MNGILVSLFKYKAWANAELHAALAKFNAQQHPEAFHTMLRTLDDVNVVDRIFQGHLIGTGAQLFVETNTEQAPSLPLCVR